MQWAAAAVVVAATVVILGARLRAASPARRRVLGPLIAYGLFAVVFAFISAQVTVHLFPDHQEARVAIQIALLAGVPVAFAGSVLLGGFARMGEVEELGAWLGAESDGRATLADALAETLGDPSLELVLWVPEAGGYVDFAGDRVTVPAAHTERALVEVRRGARRVGAIVYDATLIGERDLVEAAARMTAIALDRERLTVELTASRDELLRSRARIAQAADDERRRIARDLHDGLQARLVVLAIGADRLAADAATPERPATRRTSCAPAWSPRSAELRGLVQGVMPAALIERGLPAAAEDLADRMPLPDGAARRRTLASRDGAAGRDRAGRRTSSWPRRWPTPSSTRRRRESSSAGPRATAPAHRGAPTTASAAPRPAGAGMRGMADRVEALGGRLDVDSPPGGGTRVRGGAAVRVVIGEDEALLREGLALVLERAGFEIVAAGRRRARRAREARAPTGPTWCVTDIRMPPGHTDDGLRAALTIRAEQPGHRRCSSCPSTCSAATPSSCSSQRPPASATCSSSGSPTSTRSSRDVRRVCEGGTALDPEVVAAMLAGLGGDGRPAATG